MKRVLHAGYWLLPSLLCLLIYWLGLWAWFQRDDFAWLTLHREFQSWRDLGSILFTPRAQGSIRPLSERLFFLAFWDWFGLNAFPYHVLVFLTQCANLVLICRITRRLAGSAAAGLLAAIFWIANSGLAETMVWTSAYNQVLFAFFLLLAFELFLVYVQTGQTRYYVAQWVVFVVGFGALELNVVYPAIACAYTLFFARRHVLKTLPMLAVSGAYMILHSRLAPTGQSGVYGLHFDTSMLATLGSYWSWALVPEWFETNPRMEVWFQTTVLVVLSASLLLLAAARLRRRDYLPLFLLCWFILLLSPVLPLRDHMTRYYVSAPAIGLAMAGGIAAVRAWALGTPARTTVLVLAAVYLAPQISAAQVATRWYYEQSQRAEEMVLGTLAVRERHPNTLLLLTGVDSSLFGIAVRDKPFWAVGATGIHLAPEVQTPYWDHLEDTAAADPYTLPARISYNALNSNRAVVLNVAPGYPMNVTALFLQLARKDWKLEEPRRIDVGNSYFAGQLGSTWHAAEHESFRWMPKRATVRVGPPRSESEMLRITAYCPAIQLRDGPLHLTATANGQSLGTRRITQAERELQLTFGLPKEAAGWSSMEVVLEVDRTFRAPADYRDLGLAITTIEVR